MSKGSRIEHKDGIIYMFRNKINGKRYIGQTIDENRRYSEHKLGHNSSYFFRKDIESYGFNNFEYKVLFRIHCNNEQDLRNTLNIKEIVSIKFFKSDEQKFGYNLTKGGSYTKPPKVMCGFPVIVLNSEGEYIDEYCSAASARRAYNIRKENVLRSCNYFKDTGVYFITKGYIFVYKDDWDRVRDKSTIKIRPHNQGKKTRYLIEKYSLIDNKLLETYKSMDSASRSIGLKNRSLFKQKLFRNLDKTSFEYRGYLWVVKIVKQIKY